MQWDDSPNAGFAAAQVETWLPIAHDYARRNVAGQENDPTSMLNFFRALTRLRQAEPALNIGSYESVETEVDDVFAYRRAFAGSDNFLVVLNFGNQRHTLDLSRIALKAVVDIATDMVRNGPVDLSELVVNPNEGLVLRLSM
jgi:alpha-glucosidase